MTIAAGRLRTPASRMKMGKYACVPLNGSQWLWLAWSWYGWTLALARSTRGRTFGPPQPNCLAGRRRLARWADQATTEARAIILVPRAGSGEMSDEARQCCGADFCRRALGKCSRARSVGPPDWRPKGVLRGGQEFATGGIWRWSSRVAYRMAMRSWGGLRMRARGGRRRLQRSQPKPCPFAFHGRVVPGLRLSACLVWRVRLRVALGVPKWRARYRRACSGLGRKADEIRRSRIRGRGVVTDPVADRRISTATRTNAEVRRSSRTHHPVMPRS